MVLKDGAKEREAVSEPNDTTKAKRAPRLTSVLASVSEYKAPDAMPKCHRMAHFFDWFARKHPKVPVPANVVYRAITGIPRTPRMDAPEVEAVLGGMSAARSILKEQYRRGLVSERGLGFRATTDDEDTANTQMRRDARRLVSAHKALDATAAIVDPAKVKNPELRAWVSKAVNPLLKALNEGDRIHRLLPKGDDDAE